MRNYGQYKLLVSTVEMVCEQSAQGYHLGERDLDALAEAISDLVSIYNTQSNASALELKWF